MNGLSILCTSSNEIIFQLGISNSLDYILTALRKNDMSNAINNDNYVL